MEALKLEETKNTPEIKLDPDANVLWFKGESRPESVQVFYRKILSWIESYKGHLHYLKDLNEEVRVQANFDFEYFNSSSAKYIMDILEKLKELSCEKILVTINWFYDSMDEDLLDSGKEFEEMLDIKLNFISK